MTTKRLVGLVGVGEDRLAQLEMQGWIARAGRNSWPAIETLAGLVKFYRDGTRRKAMSEAEAELRSARTREIELRTAEREHRLIALDESLAALDQIIGCLIALLNSMPARIGGSDLALRARVEEEVYRIRTEAARTLSAQANALRTCGHARG